MKTNPYVLTAFSLVAAVVISGCLNYGGGGAAVTTEIPAGAKVVEITDSGFSPQTLTINAGDTVAWVNKDTAAHWPASANHPTHTVYPEPGGCNGSKFDACKGLAQNDVFAFTFTQKGEWKYHDHLNCCTNAKFFGTIVVK